MSDKTTNLFPDIVGQDKAKKKLKFFHRGYEASGIIPHLMFIAPKGCGKTTLAKAIGRQLKSNETGKTKRFLEINCSTIKNVKQFFNQVIVPHVANKECTILFDEASELPKDVTMMLLTCLNPNENNRNEFAYEDYVVDFDFRIHSFLFATTEAHKIFHALMDRCERVDLEEYSYNQLGTIIARQMKGIKFEKGVLDDVATVLRGNARAAQKMANNMKTYLQAKNSKKFTYKDWLVMKDELGILPLGVNRIELIVLNALKQKKECSLTHLAAKTGLTPQCLRQDFEMYLQKMSLMEITTSGRALTKTGHEYLEAHEDGV
jgi:Holliday junction resolvasome RuvABC ATP-dependent DNA helicase subunit